MTGVTVTVEKLAKDGREGQNVLRVGRPAEKVNPDMSVVFDTVAGKPPGREEADFPHPDHWWVEMVTFPHIGPAGPREDRGGGSG
jgi:hypothetical protein